MINPHLSFLIEYAEKHKDEIDEKKEFFINNYMRMCKTQENIIQNENKENRILYIEPTNICNVSCIFCPRHKITRKKGYIDLELYNKILNDASISDVKYIRLFLYGEPTLHPHLATMIKMAKEKGFIVDTNSNALALNEQLSRKIILSGLDSIVFSVDSIIPEIYENMRIGSNLHTVLNNIYMFKSIRDNIKQEKPHITIQTMETTSTRKENSIGFFRYYADSINLSFLSNRNNTIEGLEKLQINKSPVHSGTCFFLDKGLSIYWNGDTTVCCGDYNGDYILGNIANKSINELLDSPILHHIKESIKINNLEHLPLCNTCESNASYNVLLNYLVETKQKL